MITGKMATALVKCAMLVNLFIYHSSPEATSSQMIVLKSLPAHSTSGEAVSLTIRIPYKGLVEFVEADDFQIVVNISADNKDKVDNVDYQYVSYQGNVLLQFFDKEVALKDRSLEYLILAIFTMTFLAFVASLVFVVWWNKKKRPYTKVNHFITAVASSAPLLDSNMTTPQTREEVSSVHRKKRKKPRISRSNALSSEEVSSEDDLNYRPVTKIPQLKITQHTSSTSTPEKQVNGNHSNNKVTGEKPLEQQDHSKSVGKDLVTFSGIPRKAKEVFKNREDKSHSNPAMDSTDGSDSNAENKPFVPRTKSPQHSITTSDAGSKSSPQITPCEGEPRVAGKMPHKEPTYTDNSFPTIKSYIEKPVTDMPYHVPEKSSDVKITKSSGPRIAGFAALRCDVPAPLRETSVPDLSCAKPNILLTAFNSPFSSEDHSSQDSPQSVEDNTNPRLNDEAYATMSSGSDISTLKNSSTSSGGSSGSVATVIAKGTDDSARLRRLVTKPDVTEYGSRARQCQEQEGKMSSPVSKKGSTRLLHPKMMHLALCGLVTCLSLCLSAHAAATATPASSNSSETSVHVKVYVPRGFISGQSSVIFSEKHGGQVHTDGFLQTPQISTYDVPDAQIHDLNAAKCINNSCHQGCDPNTGKCLCRRGFQLNDNNRCIDVNECSENNEVPACSPNSRCYNTDGSFFCICSQGFYKKGNQCESCDKPCPSGTFEAKPCQGSYKKMCKECDKECPPERFIIQECTEKHNITCAPCRDKCGPHEFEITPCYGRINRQCRPISILPFPQGSENLILENRTIITDISSYLIPYNHTDGPVRTTVVLQRDNGFSVQINVKEANLAPVFQAANHSMGNENNVFYGQDDIISRYCPYPMPQKYQLSLVPHRGVTSKAVFCSTDNRQTPDSECRTEVGYYLSATEPCETYGKFGRLPKLNPKGWSITCVRPGFLTDLFDISSELEDVTPVFYDNSIGCATKRNICDTCHKNCARTMQQTQRSDPCNITAEDSDNGESPRLKYCMNCCAKRDCRAGCNVYQSLECKPVRCASGTIAEIILTPVFSHENSVFFCHVEQVPNFTLYDIEYAVYQNVGGVRRLVNNKVLHTKVTYSDKTAQKTIFKHNFLKIVTKQESSLGTVPDIIKGYAGPTPKFTAGHYKIGGKEIKKDQVSTGRSINIKPKRPFAVSTKQWEMQSCDTTILSEFVIKPRSENDPFKPENGLGIKYVDKGKYRIYNKTFTYYLYFEVLAEDSILAPLFEPASIQDNRSLKAELTRESNQWTIKMQGELTNCPGYFGVKIFDSRHPEHPLYIYDVGVKCPKTFTLNFVIPTEGLDDHDKTFDVELTDSYRKINIKVHRPAPQNVTTYSYFRRTTTEPIVNGRVSLDGLGQQQLQVFTPLVAIICMITVFLSVVLIIGFLTMPESVAQPDIGIQNFHLVFVVGYVTLRTAFALTVTFTVLVLIMKAVNSISEPIMTLQQYPRYLQSVNAMQNLQINSLKEFVSEEIDRQNREANNTKYQCEQLLNNVHSIVEELKRNLTLKGVQDMSMKSITLVASEYTKKIISNLSERILEYKEEFSSYAQAAVKQLMNDIGNTFSTISNNKWLVAAKIIHDSVVGKRNSIGKSTKPFMEWIGLKKDRDFISTDLTLESFPLPNMDDFTVPVVNHSQSRKAQAPSPANITIPENKWTFYQADKEPVLPTHSALPSVSAEEEEGKEWDFGWTSLVLSVLIVDLVWLIHRTVVTYSTAKKILYGYPCFIDCRTYQDDVYHSMVQNGQKKSSRREDFTHKCLKFVKDSNIKVMKTLFIPKVVAVAALCCFFYLVIASIDKLLTVQTLASVGYFDTMVAPVVTAHRLARMRIKTNAYRINKFEFPFHEELFNERLKRYQLILDLYNHMYRTNSLLQDIEFCNWRKKLDPASDCNCTTVEKVEFSFSGCEFPPVMPVSYGRHNISEYKRHISQAVIPYLNAARKVVETNTQIILTFLGVLLILDLLGAVLWIYLKRFNLLRTKTLYEVDRHADSSIER